MTNGTVYPYKVTLYKFSERAWAEKNSESFTTKEAAIARRDILNIRDFGKIDAGLDHYCVRRLDTNGQYQEIECGLIHPTKNADVYDVTCDCASYCLTHIKIQEDDWVMAIAEDWRFISDLCETGPDENFRRIGEGPGYTIYEAPPELIENEFE